jgi:hypothetical protein
MMFGLSTAQLDWQHLARQHIAKSKMAVRRTLAILIMVASLKVVRPY